MVTQPTAPQLGIYTNFQKPDRSTADMCFGEIRRFCKLQDEGQSLMQVAMTQLSSSPHAYYRILKLARTIADPAGSE